MVWAFAFVATTTVFYVAVAAAFLREATTAPTRRVRMIALVASGLALQFATGAAWAAGVEADEVGWISDAMGRLLTDWLGTAVEILALVVGLAALLILSRVQRARQALQITAILSRRVAHNSRLAELSLTARELQVLELMTQGQRTDQEISDGLSISAATAATHVRNVMRKAGVNRREDLMLLHGAAPEDVA